VPEAPRYAVDIRPAARRGLRQLDATAREAVTKVIDELAADPSGAVALQGHRPYLRVRSGDYRVIYAVDDRAWVVTVAVVGHRREIYRNLNL
jgi:mRNA interferase RelE/StbE